MNIKHIVRFLLKNDILRFGEFRLKSGRSSPYYFNLRTPSDCEVMSKVGDLYAEKIYQDIGLESFDALLGVAYAGILPCYLTAESLWRNYQVKKRFAYNRKEIKRHGDPKNKALAGGQLKENDTILIVDDVLTTGETKMELRSQLEGVFQSLKFRGLLVFLDRCEVNEAGHDAKQTLEKQGLPVFSILPVTSMLDNLMETVDEVTIEKLRSYVRAYGRR